MRTQAVGSFRIRRRGRVRYLAHVRAGGADEGPRRAPRDPRGVRRRNINGPIFEVSDSTAARQEATRIALQRARARAEAAAAALGMRILAIRKVDLNAEFGFDSGDTEAFDGVIEVESGSGGSAEIQIERGQEPVRVNVAVVYAIGP